MFRGNVAFASDAVVHQEHEDQADRGMDRRHARDLVRRDPSGRVQPQGLHLHQAQHPGPVSLCRAWNRPRRCDANPRGCGYRTAGVLRTGGPDPGAISVSTSGRRSGFGLSERHPELFKRAVAIERKVLSDAGFGGDADFGEHAMRGREYTWSGGETLTELRARREEILERHEGGIGKGCKEPEELAAYRRSWAMRLTDEDDTTPCTVCAL